MPNKLDLTELKAYLEGLAQPHCFLVDVQISRDIELPNLRKGQSYIEVSVHKTSKVSLEPAYVDVSVREFEREGVHAFDVHMADACRARSAL